MFLEQSAELHQADDIANDRSKPLRLPISANGIEILPCHRIAQSSEVIGNRKDLIEFAAARNFFEQMWMTNQLLSGEGTGVKGLNQQLQELGVGREQFEKQAA